jgi:hypothetical protein
LCIDPDFFGKRLGVVTEPRSNDDSDLVDRISDYCEVLTGELPTPAAAEYLARCLSAEPSVRPKHVSFMVPRPGAPTKLDVALPVGQLAGFLDRMAWPEPPAALERAVRELVPWDGDIQLNMIADPGATGILEVEVFAGASARVANERAPFLDRLVRAQLASPAKAKVLLQAWERPITSAVDGRCLARSWYVKVRFSRGGPRDAKVYLGLMPRPARLVPRE